MFGLFKPKSEREKLISKHKKLLEESYKLSHSNRKASDDKMMQAAELQRRIDELGK
jgi:hypothetical protein